MLYNREEFILRSKVSKPLTLSVDPMGGNDTETNIGRSEKTFGIFTSISNNCKFIGEAFDLLELNWNIYGVNAEVSMVKRVKNKQTDEWDIEYEGILDFNTRNIEDNKFSIDFIEGGLKEVMEAQMREKFEFNRSESVEGKPISELVLDEITMEGREIFLLSKLSQRTDTFTHKSGKWSAGQFRESFHPLPLNVDANSDPLNIDPPYETYKEEDRWDLSLQNFFYKTGDRDKGRTTVKLNASYKINFFGGSGANDVSAKLVFWTYTSNEDGSNLVLTNERVLLDMGVILSDSVFEVGTTYTLNETSFIIEPKKNENYAFGIYMVGRYGGGGIFGNSTGNIEVEYTECKASLSWAEDSFYPRTNAPFITAYDAGKRFTEIFTGKKKFISKLLSEGKWKDLGFTCGGWIRNARKKVDITDAQGIVLSTELKDWPMTMSMEDFYKSIHAIVPVGYGIVRRGAKQFIALEHIRYFFQPKVLIKLGEVTKEKRYTASEFVFTSITTGYTKGGKLEKPFGLDEPNIQATNTTPVNKKSENKYVVLGPSRTDGYAIEDARRQQWKDGSDEDTEYDQDNVLCDAKFLRRSNQRDYFEFKLWADTFEVAPSGIYSPETAINLDLSPANNKLRHSIWFNSALVKFPTEYLRYSSNEGNSELQTKLTGKPTLKENDNILISRLSKPIFEPEWIEFETSFSQEFLSQIRGTTRIDGQDFNNYYGLVEFINKKGKKERGYLFTAKIKNTINWKILKAYGV